MINHGHALSDAINGLILWLFPNGETGLITRDDATYLTRLNLGLIKPDPRRKSVNVLQ